MAKNQRLDATITIGSVLQGTVKRNFNVLRAGLDSVGDEIKRVADRQRELSRQRKVLEKEGRAVDDLDREYEDLGRQLDTLRSKQEKWERAVKTSRRVGDAMRGTVRDVGRLARTSSIVVGGASAAIFGVANSTAKAGDQIAKTADRLGVGVEAFQELRFAADRSGIDESTFTKSLEAFTKRLGEAKEGTGEAVKALETLGLTAEEVSALDTEQQLGLIADRMNEIADPALRNALTADLFSRGGQKMLNLLAEGSDGMADLGKEARNVGEVLDEVTVRGGETFQDRLTDFQAVVGGLKNTIGSELMPVVGDAMKQFSSFMLENREEVKAFASDFADGVERVVPKIGGLIEKVAEFGKGLADVARPIGKAVAKVGELMGGFENAGTIIGGFFAAKFIGAAFASTPIGIIIGLLAAAALTVVENWDEISAFFQRTWRKVGDAFSQAWESHVKPVIDNLKSAGGAIVEGWQTVKSGLGAVMEWLGEKFDWLWQKIEPVVKGLTFLRDKGAAAVNAVGSLFGGGDDAPANTFNPVTGEGRPVKRAIGGAFAAGRALLVGENGPEAMFPTQGGFIANNRQLERMAALAESVVQRGAAVAQQAVRSGAQITQNITVNAQGVSAREVAEEIDRLRRDAEERALFDPVTGFGQYGGAG
ncbi:hypothetical protein [Roseovarius ramblicola]|uniref:Uncharacterized protein n=1 Tax=Roseovarius ramblicola TaxID=2022336 RepID=A0ABV5HYM3_9RHOB